MVMLDISHRALNDALSKNLTVEDIRAILFDMGFDIKGVEDDSLAVEITPERLDLVSLQGLANAIKSFKEWDIPKVDYKVIDSDYIVTIEKNVKNVRPYTVCAVIKNLSLNDALLKQIIDVQEKLHVLIARGRTKGAIGIYPLDKIAMPIRFTAAKPENIKFTPLGAKSDMTGHTILTEHETGQKFAHLLEGEEMYPYFVDANDDVMSMPPVINSEKTGRVTVDTKEIFIECSGFDKLLLNEMLNNLVIMFSSMGGDIYSVNVKDYDGNSENFPQLAPREITVTKESIKKYLGLEFSDEDVKKLLAKMMFATSSIDKDSVNVKIPAFRRDIWHQIDIIDDIARAYGYNNFELQIPDVSTIGSTLPTSNLRDEVADVMVGLGFLETYTNILVGEKEHIDFMCLEKSMEKIEILNGNETQTMMRQLIIPELLSCIANNRSNPLPQKIFEVASTVFPDETSDVKSRSEMHLSAMMCDNTVTFTQIRQILDAVLKTRGLEAKVEPIAHPSFLKGRVGEVFIDGVSVGLVGEISPQVIVNFGLSAPVGAFEINLEKVIR